MSKRSQRRKQCIKSLSLQGQETMTGWITTEDRNTSDTATRPNHGHTPVKTDARSLLLQSLRRYQWYRANLETILCSRFKDQLVWPFLLLSEMQLPGYLMESALGQTSVNCWRSLSTSMKIYPSKNCQISFREPWIDCIICKMLVSSMTLRKSCGFICTEIEPMTTQDGDKMETITKRSIHLRKGGENLSDCEC